jgi:choline dehydrogenase
LLLEQTDHMSIPIAWEVPVTESLTYLATSPMKGALEFFKYLFLRLGLLSMACQALSLFVRSSSLTDSSLDLKPGISPSYSKKEALANSIPPKDYIPDIEIMPLATSAMDDLEEHKRLFSKIGVFSFLTTLVQPKSRGTVRLASSNPLDKPKVDFGFLSNPDDFTTARKAIRLALKLGDAMKSKRFPLIRPIVVPEVEKGDEAIDSFIRRRARTAYHYACTCRMAPENDAAPGVVDDELRVHGVQGLRVCDASVFPRIISSHLQAPVAMMAERLADMIKKS